MHPDIANKYRIKLGLSVALIITLITFGVLWQDFHVMLMLLIGMARFLYVFAIWLLYFPVSKRFKNKATAFLAYLLVCVIAILPLIPYHFWVSDVTGSFFSPFEDPAAIKNKVEYFRFYYMWRAVGMGLLIYPIQYREDLLRDKQFYLVANEKLKNQNLIHQLESLKQQIDPHFLFNTINALKTLIRTDPDKAENYAVELSNVYRYLLRHNRNQTVVLKEELAFLHAYLSLLQLRFEGNLQVNVAVDETLHDKMIFPLSLQLLVENAVKHNVVTKDAPLEVHIYTMGNSIAVENKIKLRTTTEGVSQYGLAHLSTLYRLHYNKEVDVLNTTTIFQSFLAFNLMAALDVIIIEDEQKAAANLATQLSFLNREIKVLATLDSIAGSVHWFMHNPMPDLVFMDIHLGDGNCFEIFKRVPLTCPVIFCTAYDEYALEAFKQNSIGYIMKPIDRERLAEALQKYHVLQQHYVPSSLTTATIARIIQQPPRYKTSFLVPFKNKMVPIPVNAIACIYVRQEHCCMVTSADEFAVGKTLEQLQLELDPSMFYRVNRQYLVSFRYIKEIEQLSGRKVGIILSVPYDEPIVVSKDAASGFRTWMEDR